MFILNHVRDATFNLHHVRDATFNLHHVRDAMFILHPQCAKKDKREKKGIKILIIVIHLQNETDFKGQIQAYIQMYIKITHF